MGSLSLIIVLIIVVWVIVLAPMVMGTSKPIRRSGEGFEETRVLHRGGTAAVPTRRRPRLTAADVHRFDTERDEDYEFVEVEAEAEAETENAALVAEDSGLRLRGFFTERAGGAAHTIDGEVVSDDVEIVSDDTENAEEAQPHQDAAGLAAQDDVDDAYVIDESYVSPADYGYATADNGCATAEVDAEKAAEKADETPEADRADGTSDAAAGDNEDSLATEAELTSEEIEFARTRRGRGGWDPERDRASKADRFQRRQRTLLALVVADVLAFVAGFVAGGWAWLIPVTTFALTAWFMVALRAVVQQERALHARRVRQLRRARMGVIAADRGDESERLRRRAGAIIVDAADESPDFADLPVYRYSEPETVAQAS